jgi:hypothetical protein
VALTYGKQRGNHLTKFVERQIFATWFPEVSNYQQSHPFCNNANAAIRKELWERHPYDETLAGLEDLDWANWAISEQYVLAYNAEAEVIHVHEERPGQVYNRYRREAMALKRIQPQAKFRFVDFLRLFFSNIVSDCWHAIRARLLTKEIEGIIWFRFMQFWGTYRGFAISGDLTSQLKRTFYYPRGFKERAVEEQREISPINYPGVRARNQEQDD